MESTVAIYNTHDEALEAVKVLERFSFPLKNVSIVGKIEIIEDQIETQPLDKIKNDPALIGVGIGTTVGLLSGIGLFAIPGLGFMYGAGAVVGAIAGFDFGLVGGGLVSLLKTIGIKEDKAVNYESHLSSGRYLLIVKGAQEEIDKAKEILSNLE